MNYRVGNKYVNYILALILLFTSTATVPIFEELPTQILLMAFVSVLFFVFNNTLGSAYFKFIFIVVIFSFGYLIQFFTFSPFFTLRTVLAVTTSYMIIKILGWSLIPTMEDIVYRLSILSLIFFSWQLVSFQTAFSFLGQIENILPFGDFGGERNVSIVFFVVKDYAMQRNSGFAWEPGAFAAFLSFPIFFNLVNSNFRLNRRFYFMTMALLTTFSTMGYFILITLLIFYYIQFQRSNRTSVLSYFIFGILIFITIFFVFQRDFMLQKVGNEIAQSEELIDNSQIDLGSKKDLYSLGRIASLQLDFQDFLRFPVFGFGGQDENLTQSIYYTLNRNNGWGRYFRTFGLLGTILLLLNLKKTASMFQEYYSINHFTIFFLSIFFIFTFSNGIIMSPLIIGYQWFSYVIPARLNFQKRISNEG